MLVRARGSIDELSRPAPLENKNAITELKYMSLIACGSIHQGHERLILVMTLEEDKRILCVWLLVLDHAKYIVF